MPTYRQVGLTSPANVLSGGGATPEQIEIVRGMAANHRRMASFYRGVEDRALSMIHANKADALESLLAEREGLRNALDRLVKAEWASSQKFEEPEINELEAALKQAEEVLKKGEP